jgi:hypothetical protein
MHLSLLSAVRAARRHSLAQLRAATASSTSSARDIAQRALLHRAFLEAGGARGPLGLPIGRSTRLDNGAMGRAFEGGALQLSADGAATVTHRKRFTVHFLGLHCLDEAETDQSSSSDEPYVLWFVEAGSVLTPVQRISFGGVDRGEFRVVDQIIGAAGTPKIGVPFIIHAMVIEHDGGSRERAAERLGELARAAHALRDEAVRVVEDYAGAVPTDVSGKPLTTLGLGTVIANFLGLADDFIGYKFFTVFRRDDFETTLDYHRKMVTPPLSNVAHFGAVPFSHMMEMRTRKSGSYRLFFRTEIHNEADVPPG